MLRITLIKADGTESTFDTDLDAFKQWLSETPLTVHDVLHITEVPSDNAE